MVGAIPLELTVLYILRELAAFYAPLYIAWKTIYTVTSDKL